MTTSKKLSSLFLSLVVLLFLFSGCDTGTAPGVSSSTLFVPSGSDVTGAVTVSGGMMNTKEQMYWLAEALQDGGIIALAISATNNFSISGYEDAHLGGLTILRNNTTIRSRLGKLGIMGYSMGGGAVINLGATDGVDVVVAMAPYSPDTPSRDHDAATMILTGTSDVIAPPRMGEGAYNNLPSTTPRLYASLIGKTHTYWMTSGSKGSEVDFIVAWSQYYLNANQSAYSVFSQGPGIGMTDYKFNAGSSSSSSSSGGCN